MSGPIYGGRNSLNEVGQRSVKGVYANHPAGTPKFNASNSTAAALETQAQMFVNVPDTAAYQAYLEAVPQSLRHYVEGILNSGEGPNKAYLNFLVQSISEPLQEKVQISEVLSDTFVSYFFGQRAPTWSYQCMLLNTQQDPWYEAWTVLYNVLLRGTKLSERGFTVTLMYDNRMVTGYLLGQSTSLSADNETAVPMQFQMLVSRFTIIATPQIELAASVQRPDASAALGAAQQGVTASVQVATSLSSTVAVTQAAQLSVRDALNYAVRAGADMDTVYTAAELQQIDEQGAIEEQFSDASLSIVTDTVV